MLYFQLFIIVCYLANKVLLLLLACTSMRSVILLWYFRLSARRSVCLSVCLCNAVIVSKRMYIFFSLFQLSGRNVVVIFCIDRPYKIPRGIRKRGALNTRRSTKNSRLSTKIALYIGKGRRWLHDYYGLLTRSICCRCILIS